MKIELDTYLVIKYPKIFIDRNKSPKESLMAFGFEHDNGWFWILDNLCGSIQNHIDNMNDYSINNKTIPQVIASQVKEKFGVLNFYYSGGDDIIDGMVFLAENLSSKTCEICGTMKNVGKTSGWVVTCCEDCYKTNNRLSNMVWEKLKDNLTIKQKRKLKILNIKTK